MKKVNYKKQEELNIDFKRPKLPNSYFAQFDFKDLKIYKNNMPVKGYWSSRVHGNTNYSHTLSSLEYDLPSPDIDKVSGKMILKYPAEFISHQINQGDNKVGFSLLDYSFFILKIKIFFLIIRTPV